MERRKGTPAHPPIPASSQSPRAVPAGKPRPQEAWLGSGQGVHSLLEVDILILPVPGVGEVAGVGLCPAGEQRVLGDVDSDVLRRGDDEGRPWGTGTNVTSPGAGVTTAPAAGALPPRKGRPSPRSVGKLCPPARPGRGPRGPGLPQLFRKRGAEAAWNVTPPLHPGWRETSISDEAVWFAG